MKLKDEKKWKKFLDGNKSAYGSAVCRYAERWADLMEQQIELWGLSVGRCAEKARRDADTEYITGFQYGCAVSMLAVCWKHGEELRKWHNLKTQLQDEGERANKEGGVLNPALLNIGGEGK